MGKMIIVLEIRRGKFRKCQDITNEKATYGTRLIDKHFRVL